MAMDNTKSHENASGSIGNGSGKTSRNAKRRQMRSKQTKSENILKPVSGATAKAQTMMSKTVQGMQKGLSSPDVTDTIARGAAGVAITAGVVAAGAALMNKETRKKVGKTAKKGFDKLSEYAAMLAEENGVEQYQAVASQVSSPKKSTKSKKAHRK